MHSYLHQTMVQKILLYVLCGMFILEPQIIRLSHLVDLG